MAGPSFELRPQQLRAAEFGVELPSAAQIFPGAEGRRQRVLLETLAELEKGSPTARYHELALHNLQRWAQETRASRSASRGAEADTCAVLVLPGDWGDVTLELTRRFGTLFASLNMANAYGPGGGYTHGMVAQEENMFRRTDCHFSLRPEDIGPDEEYVEEQTELLNAKHGRVYLDVAQPRVCIRGPEERERPDLGYRWLADDEVR